MLSHEILHEIHFSDLYPKTFSIFHAKYLPLVGDASLYVNFTNAVGDTVNKSFSINPNHSDPVGLYTYPLDYVIKNPSNIEYGQQAGYLRVIRSTAANKLVINTMSAAQAIDLLTRMGVEEPVKKMAFVQRRYSYGLGNLAAKQFLGVLQTYVTVGQKRLTPNAQQTALLLKAGVDCLEDKSKTASEAVIYEAEPEQCVFLRRSAFKVIDIYRLRGEAAAGINHSDPTEQFKRLPGMIAQAIGDRIIGNNLTGEQQVAMTFYTQAKRKIVVTMNKEYRFLVRHRASTDHSGDKIAVVLMGPDFEPVSGDFDSDVSYRQITADIAVKFAARRAGTNDPYDVQAELGPAITATNATLVQMAAKLKLPFNPPINPATAQRVYRTVKEIETTYGAGYYGPAKTDRAIKIQAVIDHLWPGNRQPQGAQVGALWTAAMKRKGVTMQDSRSLDTLAKALGLMSWFAQPVTTTGESFTKQYGDLTLFRRGNALMVRIGSFEQPIAEIDNTALAWKQPDRHGDQRYLIGHAKDICAYLNSQHFVTEGYNTFLPEKYGITCQDGTWTPFEAVSEQVSKIGTLPVWKVPDRNGASYYGIMAEGDTPADKEMNAHLPPERQDHDSKWRHFAILFSVNDENQINFIGADFKSWLQLQKRLKAGDQSASYFYNMTSHDITREQKTAIFSQFEKADFDLKAFITKLGLGLSPWLNQELDLFDMKLNRDNGAVGRTVSEIMVSVGTFGGIEVFSYRAGVNGDGQRAYLVRAGDKLRVLMKTETDSKTGQGNVKILAMSETLTTEERAATTALLAHLQMPVPSKFRSYLTIKKPGRSTA